MDEIGKSTVKSIKKELAAQFKSEIDDLVKGHQQTLKTYRQKVKSQHNSLF